MRKTGNETFYCYYLTSAVLNIRVNSHATKYSTVYRLNISPIEYKEFLRFQLNSCFALKIPQRSLITQPIVVDLLKYKNWSMFGQAFLWLQQTGNFIFYEQNKFHRSIISAKFE